ncbi:hypothetical protein ACF6ZU_20140 [Pseudomonas migulae]|jgi:hypothetical protein|uniref:hypothetical protein n=1 Tax=Pseudomonas migulae TaxID=78543 RepID=UPI003715F077
MTDFPSNTSSNAPNEMVEDSLLLEVSKIVDDDGVSIVNKTTYKTVIRVSGINAVPRNKVSIMNLHEKLGEADTDDVGAFESQLLNLKNFDCHNVRAKGHWLPTTESLPKRFTAATLTPIIRTVFNEGVPVEDKETIVATEVTLHCDALPNQPAEAFNEDVLLKMEPATACGKCVFRLEVEEGSYNITVKTNNGKVSTPFNFTVVAQGVEPVTLKQVTDSNGTPIADGATTPDKNGFVEGTCEPGKEAEVFVNGVLSGKPTVDPVTGVFKFPIGPLDDGDNIITVIGNYFGGGTAGPHTIKVETATTAPTDTRIYDADGRPINNGGDINKNWFIARGLHTPDSAVKIKVNDVIQPVPEGTNAEGKWVYFQSDLIVGSTYKVSALTLDEKAESNSWSVVARAPT